MRLFPGLSGRTKMPSAMRVGEIWANWQKEQLLQQVGGAHLCEFAHIFPTVMGNKSYATLIDYFLWRPLRERPKSSHGPMLPREY